ncbi:MAG: hypothetical protein JNL75_11760 [Chitinophagales bacterium]|nr:hypothetical protein [Chitinophagales bacterium]
MEKKYLCISMKVAKTTLILTLILLSKENSAQSFLDTLNYSIDSNLKYIKVDKLNNIWYIYENKIIRTSSEQAYNDTLDNLNIQQLSLDLSTPLKNLFYFRNKNSVEIKNSRWGLISSFKLDALQIFEPSLVNFTSDKMVLILDVRENMLYKLNENGVKVNQKTNPFRIYNKYYFPKEMIPYKNYCIALDTTYGIFLIDDYGNLSQTKKIEYCQNLFEHKGKIYLSQGNILLQIQTTAKGILDFSIVKKAIFPSAIRSLQTLNENALILFENKRIYELKNFESLFK